MVNCRLHILHCPAEKYCHCIVLLKSPSIEICSCLSLFPSQSLQPWVWEVMVGFMCILPACVSFLELECSHLLSLSWVFKVPTPGSLLTPGSRPEHKACCSLPVDLILHFDVERNLALAAPRNTWPSLHEFLVSFPVEKEGFGLDLWTFLWLFLLVAFMTAAFQHLLVFVCH